MSDKRTAGGARDLPIPFDIKPSFKSRGERGSTDARSVDEDVSAFLVFVSFRVSSAWGTLIFGAGHHESDGRRRFDC